MPKAWGALRTTVDSPTGFGDNNCDWDNADSTVGFGTSVFYGPDRGISVVTGAAPETPRKITVKGRPAVTFEDPVLHGCNIAFDFGPDQTVTVSASSDLNASITSCDVANTVANAVAANLPPS